MIVQTGELGDPERLKAVEFELGKASIKNQAKRGGFLSRVCAETLSKYSGDADKLHSPQCIVSSHSYDANSSKISSS